MARQEASHWSFLLCRFLIYLPVSLLWALPIFPIFLCNGMFLTIWAISSLQSLIKLNYKLRNHGLFRSDAFRDLYFRSFSGSRAPSPAPQAPRRFPSSPSLVRPLSPTQFRNLKSRRFVAIWDLDIDEIEVSGNPSHRSFTTRRMELPPNYFSARLLQNGPGVLAGLLGPIRAFMCHVQRAGLNG